MSSNKIVTHDDDVPVLWQTICRLDMESVTGQTITHEEWERFVEDYEDDFAEQASRIAQELWLDADHDENEAEKEEKVDE